MRILFLCIFILSLGCSSYPHSTKETKVLRPEYTEKDLKRQSALVSTLCDACKNPDSDPLTCKYCNIEKEHLDNMFY